MIVVKKKMKARASNNKKMRRIGVCMGERERERERERKSKSKCKCQSERRDMEDLEARYFFLPSPLSWFGNGDLSRSLARWLLARLMRGGRGDHGLAPLCL